MDAMTVLTTRRSVRKYKPDPVSRELLEKIVNAGRLAPTARNVQPCSFVVVTDSAKRRQIAGITEHGKFIADAPACIVVLSEDTKYYLEDGSAAATNICNAAAALGLGSCWVAGDKKSHAPDIVAACGAPANLKLIASIAIGHAVEVPSPAKKTLAEVAHWDKW